MGRSRKYTHVFDHLDAETIYSASCIAKLMESLDLAPFDRPMSDKERRVNRKRISTTMAWWMRCQERPERGDGMIKIHGQRPMPGWYGWRWQSREAPEGFEESESDPVDLIIERQPLAMVS